MNNLILFFLFYFHKNNPFISSSYKYKNKQTLRHVNLLIPEKFRFKIVNNYTFSLFIKNDKSSVSYKEI